MKRGCATLSDICIRGTHVYRIVLAALLGCLLLLGQSAPAGAAAPTARSASTPLGILTTSLADYYFRRGPHDPRWYAGGIWHSNGIPTWSSYAGGPASAAAVAYAVTKRPLYLHMAEGTIDRAIAARQAPTGAFVPPARDPQPVDVATIFFCEEFGNTLLTLENDLGATRRARWSRSIARAADFLIHNKDVTWYLNGNLNSMVTSIMFFAWQATGDVRYKAAYDASWRFLLAPPIPRWKGFGLHLTHRPTALDWSNGAGYLAEAGARGPGYDPLYSHLQLTVLARLYLRSGDARALAMANLLMNQELPHVDQRDWLLTTTGGSRHPEHRVVPFTTPAMTILVNQGRRDDLAHELPRQLASLDATYLHALSDWTQPNMYRGLGSELAVVVQSEQAARAHTSVSLVGSETAWLMDILRSLSSVVRR